MKNNSTNTLYINDELIEEVEIHFITGRPILLVGPPGAGKTALCFYLAQKHGYEPIVITGKNSMTDADMLGNWVMGSEKPEWRDGPLSRAMKLASEDKKILLILDEITRIPPHYQNILVEILNDTTKYGRKVWVLYNHILETEYIAPKENLKIIATGNTGQIGTYNIDEALLDRFACHFKVNYPNFKNELKILKEMGLDDFTAKVLVSFAVTTRRMFNEGYLDAPLSTRGLVEITETYLAVKNHPNYINKPEMAILLKVIKGSIGKLTGVAQGDYESEEKEEKLTSIFNNIYTEIYEKEKQEREKQEREKSETQTFKSKPAKKTFNNKIVSL